MQFVYPSVSRLFIGDDKIDKRVQPMHVLAYLALDGPMDQRTDRRSLLQQLNRN